MYEFHPVHDRDIWLSKGNTVADWCGGVSAQNTVLSRYPIQPGDTFTVRVTQANTGSWLSVLTIIIITLEGTTSRITLSCSTGALTANKFKSMIHNNTVLLLIVQYPSLELGVTQVDPRDWYHETDHETKTWSMDTDYGNLYTCMEGPVTCHMWRRTFGRGHKLSDGDTVSLRLCDDRSVTFTHRGTEVTRVFTDLPQRPLWVFIKTGVRRLEILQMGED